MAKNSVTGEQDSTNPVIPVDVETGRVIDPTEQTDRPAVSTNPLASAAQVAQADAARVGNPSGDGGVAAVKQATDTAEAQGFIGREVDPTPNRNYTLSGVNEGAPTPETSKELRAEIVRLSGLLESEPGNAEYAEAYKNVTDRFNSLGDAGSERSS